MENDSARNSTPYSAGGEVEPGNGKQSPSGPDSSYSTHRRKRRGDLVIACTRDCYDTCIFDDKYRPMKLFPVNGFTCAKGNADLKRNKLNRITSAYVEGREVEVQEALKYLSKMVKESLKRGSERILHLDYDGNQGLLTWYYPARLWNTIRASSTDYSICSAEGHEAISLHYGSSFGATPEELKEARAVVIWASSMSTSFIHGWYLVREKPKAVVDVWVNDVMRRADLKILVRPGSDAFLAIGVLREVLARVGGFSELRDYVERFDRVEIEEATGLSWESVKALSDFYLDHKPITVIGFGLGRTLNGGHAVSLISLIPGVLGMERGFFYSNSKGWGIDFDYLRGLHISHPSRVVGMAEVGYRASEFDLVFSWNCNPIHSLPGSDRIAEAVKEGRLFLAVHGPFWDETAKLANVVIPSPTFLEKYDVVYSYWHDYLVYNEPLFKPLGVNEVDFTHEMAMSLGISDHPLLSEDPWKAVERAIRGTGVSLEELRREKVVKVRSRPERPEFKVEPLPHRLEKPRGYALVFVSDPRFLNSQFREVYGAGKPVVLNAEVEGEGKIRTEFGEVRVLFVKDSRVPKHVLVMSKSSLMDLQGKPINSIIGPRAGQYGGTPMLNQQPVELVLPGVYQKAREDR